MEFIHATKPFNSTYGGPPFGITDPGGATGFYRYLTGRWGDGTPFTFGGNGYDLSLSNPATHFVFPGDPNNPDEWSDLSEGIGLGDRRVVSSILLASLFPGGTEEVDAAYSWFREPGADHLGNVTAMYEGIENLQAWYSAQFENICTPQPACEADCIWAGDLNADGIANHYDLLALALGLNRQGPIRNGPYNWSPQAGIAWSNTQPTGTNDKHLDADGDGVATFDDFSYTSQHYNFTHSGYQPVAEYREGPELQIVVSDPLFDFSDLTAGQGGTTAIIQLTTTVPELSGLAYTLEYDTAYFQTIFGTSFINSSGRIVFRSSFSIAFPGDSDQAMVDTSGTIQQGDIHRLWIKVKENFSYPLSADSTLIRFKNIKAIRSDGTEIEIGGTTVVARFPGVAVATEEAYGAEDIHLFPNPTTGRLELRFPGRQVESIDVLDARGKLVWRKESRFIDTASLGLQQLLGGVYFVRMQMEGAVAVQRVVLQR